MMPRSWDLFEAAIAQIGESRRKALDQVLERLEVEVEGTHADRLELRAVAMAALAGEGEVPLASAIAAVESAEEARRLGWPNYYLAEAASKLGQPELLITHIGRIPDGFFADRDLRWRAIRCRELEAMAKVDMGDWAAVDTSLDEIASEYALRGDEDDLASPRELTLKLLLHAPRGLEPLRKLANSVDLSSWLEPELAAKVHDALDGQGLDL